MSDPEGRKTLRNSLRGFPERVYPVGNLEYAASGVILLTNDGDLAAQVLKNWEHLEQAYHVKVKGMLTLHDLDHLGKEAGRPHENASPARLHARPRRELLVRSAHARHAERRVAPGSV